MADSLQRHREWPLIIRIRIGSDIGIYKSVLRALGSPENIFFWWSEDKKLLLIGVGDKASGMSVPIPHRCYDKTNGFVSTNKNLLNTIEALTGWKNGSKNKIAGKYIPEINMVVFKITDVMTEVCSNV